MDISSLRERKSAQALSVTELNLYIKRIFDSDRTLNAVTVKGEISNFTNHRSGHLYFSLKDEEGQIKAVMFRSAAARLKFIPENGMRVIIHGSVTVYQRDGSYQLYANSIEPDGIGALYLAYEQLKEKLCSEGLFDESHKQPLPAFPERVGVITSPTGAAVRDIINVTGRRFPLAKIYLYPALVQGDGAAESMIKALEYFEDSRLCDVIIIGRGGGSIEDLWAFNNEILARKIYDAKTPIISAVGHETDFTICDFVADHRAPTPSAAAEIAVPDIRELVMTVYDLGERAVNGLTRVAERKREKFLNLYELLKDRASELTVNKKRDLEKINDSLYVGIDRSLKECRNRLVINSEKLNSLSPLSVLSRGYAVLQKGDKIIRDIEEISVGDNLSLTLTNGTATAQIIEKRVK